jgi:hypothetical protein
MSDGLVSFVFAIGVTGFIYANVSRRVGNGGGTAKTAIIAAGLMFLASYIFLFTLMKYVLHF